MRGRGLAMRIAAGAAPTLPLGLAAPEFASAHALVGRQDLPIPAWLFAWAASLVLIVSFALLSVAWRSPRLQEEGWRALPRGLSSALVGPVAQTLAGIAGVVLLALVVYAGLEGTEAPDRNFSLVFVFVTFWLGLVLLSVLFGDVFKAFNPWRAIARAAGGAYGLVARRPRPEPLPYPEWLGRWPAVIGLVAFLWLELVFTSGAQTGGVAPRDVALATIVYTGLTLFAMSVFGTERWLDRGETFSVYFGMFSRLSALERRAERLGVRREVFWGRGWAGGSGEGAL